MYTPSSSRRSKALTVLVCLGVAFAPERAGADDIDIFVCSAGGTSDYPNLLIILNNPSNWNRQSQHWPGGVTQGQAEVAGIQTVINNLGGGPSIDANVNVGLMLFTDSSSGRAGGYIRYAVKPMTVANKLALSNILTGIFNNLGASEVSSNANYGNTLFDAFKYFGGYTSPSHVADGVAGKPVGATHFWPPVYDTPQSNHRLANISCHTRRAL